MKVFYESMIAKAFTFLANFETIMLFGVVFTEKSELSKRSKCHEETHVTQYKVLFGIGLIIAIVTMFSLFACDIQSLYMLFLLAIPVFLFYFWYLIEYSIRYFIYLSKQKGKGWKDAHKKAYENVVFEQEACDLEYEYLKPCAERRTPYSFSFFKYYK